MENVGGRSVGHLRARVRPERQGSPLGLGLARQELNPMQDLQHIHPEPTSFLRKWVFSTDHKVIARQFLWAGLLFLAFGGGLAMLIRWQWAYPKEPVPVIGTLIFPESGGAVTPAHYNTIFTMHGLIMIFFAITPILIGAFGNYCIPLMIGPRAMPFPTLNILPLWTFLLSQRLIIPS